MNNSAPNQGSSNTKEIRRRTLIKSAAWSVPVIAAAVSAPAWALSQCTPTTHFDQLVPGTSPSTITFQPSGVTASLTFQSSGQSSSRPGATGQVARTTTQPAWNYIELQMMSSLDRGDVIDLTITLSEPVTGLSLLLHDIDKSRGSLGTNWVDTVIIKTPGFVHERGSNIVGEGTDTTPFEPNAWGDTPISGGAGRVRVTWPGEVQHVTIRYRAGVTGDAVSQHIGLGDLSYDACVLPAGRADAVQSRAKSIDRSLVAIDTESPELDESETDVDS